jgi:TPP-dependent 2-oxoacid decarboxylase
VSAYKRRLIINNTGYTIERAILNPKEGMILSLLHCKRCMLTKPEYHDIQSWDYKHLLSFFGVKDGASRTRTVRTKEEFEAVVNLPEYKTPKGIQVGTFIVSNSSRMESRQC